MTASDINIDRVVDYRSEYGYYIKKNRITGTQMIGVCPFHDDKKVSFSVDLVTGRWHCFAEDISGNFVDFISRIEGVDTKDAYKKILEKYDLLEEPKTKKQNDKPKDEKGPLPYTLEEYSFEKRLPVEFLTGVCGASTSKDKSKTSFLKLPYFNEEGKEPVYRKRYGNKEFRWSWGSSGKLILYGDWRLPKIREAGWAILVEGESDTQTLWHLGFPALGVPGASNFKEKMVPKLQDLKLYIHVEPDEGGATFFKKVTRILHRGDFIGQVYKFSCATLDVKDPSELYLKRGEGEDGEDVVKKLLSNVISQAEKVDLDALQEEPEENSLDAPVKLNQPHGWHVDDGGIKKINSEEGLASVVCRTPIIITKRLRCIETGEEKVEVAFKRDGIWRSDFFTRDQAFSARSILSLTKLGAMVTSENARQVVKYLSAFESANIDIIERIESTERMGWKPGGRFLPCCGDNIVLDVEQGMRGWADACHAKGKLEVWKELIKPHRERDKFRFIFAAGAAAPLLKILSQRSFFVYNWGGSRGGKTAALKAALSIWGDPEHLMANFNATQVALERMADFFTDMPIGIDERQLAGSKQESVESFIYMIGSGTGRARGSKVGGLQALNTWRTVAISTGEEPLSTDTSKTGVSTRVLEVYGGPFDDEKEAGLMHQLLGEHYGFAGKIFIENLMQCSEKSINKCYEKIMDDLRRSVTGAAGSHLAGISIVALADALLEDWVFNPIGDDVKTALSVSEAAYTRALNMAKAVTAEQVSGGADDVNQNATEYIVDWILSNRQYFGEKAIGTCLGTFGNGGNVAYVFPAILKQTLNKAGYSPMKTLRYWADNNIISSSLDKSGKRRYSATRWFDGRSIRMVDFNLGRFTRAIDPLDEDAAAEAVGGTSEDDTDENGFKPVEFEQQNLPFK